MHKYYAHYFDLYWDLHLGVTGEAHSARGAADRSASFTAVLGYWFPTLGVVHENFMRVRELRPCSRSGSTRGCRRSSMAMSRTRRATFVYYWLKNGGGENFRRKDIVFECFHNFLAFSQWGNTLYNVMARLAADHGDPGAGRGSSRRWRTVPTRPTAAPSPRSTVRDGAVPHDLPQRGEPFDRLAIAARSAASRGLA